MDKILNIVNNRFVIGSSNWIKIFVFLAIMGTVCLGLYNYFVDPFNYFKNEYTGVWSCSQYYKTKHILNNPNKYNCFVIGGSNSGVLDPERIEKYTGYKTYSMSFEAGNWNNYYYNIKFLINHTNVKCIVLHLSSTEMYFTDDLVSSESRRTAALTKDSWYENVKEAAFFMSRGIRLQKAGEGSLLSIKTNGMVEWGRILELFNENPEEFVQEYILNDYSDKISQLECVTVDKEKINNALNYAKEIKKLCDDNRVKLIVINGPVFISKRADFECDAYYEYLQQLINIFDIYDFSDVNEINANPYNYYDSTHYNNLYGNKVVDDVFGQGKQELGGKKLNMQNIESYIQERKNKFETLLQEYRTMGTIKYNSYNSDSRITE